MRQRDPASGRWPRSSHRAGQGRRRSPRPRASRRRGGRREPSSVRGCKPPCPPFRAGVRGLKRGDHLRLDRLGSRVTELIQLDNGRIGGCSFTVNNKTYDLACTEEHGGGPIESGGGRLHHVTYATDQREDILRAADIFLQNGVHIETGPHKHAIQGTFFLYVWEPAGNRVELANAGARLILAPDWQPVVWTEADRRKGQAWGLKTIETFHTHGTPPVQKG
nr:VOC family protein [Paracoccus siganidrum]